MRYAQIDSFPQNPAEPIPAGRASPCWHIVAWFGTTAYPLSLAYDRCLASPCLAVPSLARPCRAPPCPVGYGIKLLPAYHLKLSEHAAKRAETNGYAAFNEQVLDFLFLDFLVWENG